MNKLCVSICFLALAACVHTPHKEAVSPDKFWFIFLEAGKKTPDDKERVGQMQRGHLENFKRLFGEQKLFAAGPMQDPAGQKRGIVVVKANSKEDFITYFQPDEYVREGYLTVNAQPSIVHKPLAAAGIDPNGVEEVRIVQILRAEGTMKDSELKANHAFLQMLVDKGTIGAWYSLEKGPVAEVLFSRMTDTRMLQDTLSPYPALMPDGANVVVWRQWLGKGVLK